MANQVDVKHPDYEENEERWKRCRDTVSGSDAVKAAGKEYLPLLDKQTGPDYEAYVKRALFYGATSRTVQALLGAAFRKDPNYEVPSAFEELLESLTSNGLSILDFSRRTVRELLVVGRVGLLVDVDGEDTVYAEMYKTENIFNWRTARIDGKEEVTMVVLNEEFSDTESDEFAVKKGYQIRVLHLTKGINGQADKYMYWQQLYRKGLNNDKDTWIKYGDPVVPLRLGARLERIPFFFVNPNSLTTDTEKPVLLDLVDVNLSHYRSSADLEHGAHYTALPTAWIAGFSPDKEYNIGSRTAWVSEKVDAKAGYLEFTGQGLDALMKLIARKEQLMAVLGARMLEEQKKSAEAADTHRIRQSGESGALSVVVGTASEALELVLQKIIWWKGSNDTKTSVEYHLNDDFIDDRMKPDELIAFMKLWQSGSISQNTFLYNLKRGEILSPETSIEDEKELIATEFGAGSGTGLNEDVIPVKRQFDFVKDDKGESTGIREV